MARKWLITGALAVLVVLLTSCGIPQEQYDTAIADLGKAQQELQATKTGLETSKVEVGTLTANLDKTKAELESMKTKNAELTSSLDKRQSELSQAQAAGTKVKQEVDELKSKVTALEARIPNLIYKTHIDNEKGFSISYPETWDKQTPPQGALAFYMVPGVNTNLLVVSEGIGQVTSSQGYFNNIKQELQNQKYTFAGSKDITVSGVAAVGGVFVKGDVTQLFVVMTRSATGWAIVLTARSIDFVEIAHTFNEIIKSFKLLK